MNTTGSSNPRKRSAPGASPMIMTSNSQQVPAQPTDFSGVGDASQLSDEAFLAWGNAMQNESMSAFDQSIGGPTEVSALQTPVQNNQIMTPSTQLVRRNPQQQLATRGRSFTPGANGDMWAPEVVDGSGTSWPPQDVQDVDELERRAAEAKREAQSKRPPKQIPPFIQKLSSFCDDSNTEQLIRWSTDGNSFLVLDEDEFAKSLIPKLFKHNNYASFVRQLNMYGFHKKVGLSDNSMWASEKKSKSPSEYYNPFFKRGRPRLLWLIQKPKSEPTTTKKKGGKKSDDEDGETHAPKPGHNTELITLPKGQWQAYQSEIESLKRSQSQITTIISRLQQDNAQFIRQASAQQERHENSINAILTFLATFYHRNGDGGGGGGQGNLFPGTIPNQQPQGSVYDMGDYEDGHMNSQQARQPGMPRRQPLAIQAPPSWSPDQHAANADSPATSRAQSAGRQPSLPRVQGSVASPHNKSRTSLPRSSSRTTDSPFAREKTQTPFVHQQDAQRDDDLNLPQQQSAAGTPTVSNEDVLSAINNANASSDINTQDLDFSSALRSYENANGNTPLTPEQRESMISLLARNTGTSNPNALVSSHRANEDPFAGLTDDSFQSSLDQYNNNEIAINELKRLQADQDNKVQDLASRVQPLSPSGSIPGLDQLSSGNPGQFDINTFLDSDAFNNPDFPDANDYFDLNGGADPDADPTGDNNFDDFAFGAPAEDTGMFPEHDADGIATPSNGGKVLGSIESGSSGAPSPMVHDEADDGVRRDEAPKKRRRVA